ncbi:hypothetical protein TSUD_40550 [Trifolium subterraneum]|uniref:Uncharacterized protein n=1 Tax=Trifolium subterraneum TaxID=3900 RepID=A0A2Z6NVM7_TRISU|nr:hypothetical protein TSUD_40550 [Trifolium subterraneum]
MTNNTTETTTMVTSQAVEVSEPHKKPIFPFFPNFNFNFQIPQFPFPPKQHRHDVDGGDKNTETPKLQSEGGQHVPNVVTFPKSQEVVVPSPIQTEPDAHNSVSKTSNPVILFQVKV